MNTIGFEQSFKAKLRAIAKEKKCDPADLWQHLMVERFLVRLSRSMYSDHFILKGATLLSKYIDIGRETRDIDFLARHVSNEVPMVRSIFQEVAKIDLHDGFIFQDVQAKALPHPHMKYPGTEISMSASCGRTRYKVEIDIGFGDTVEPIAQSLPLITYSKGALFESSVELLCYPKEFIFAEKLETIVYRGAFNSRMKDFQDLCSLIDFFKTASHSKVEETIRLVFQHRKTQLSLPISYSSDDLIQLQAFWTGYVKGMNEERRKKQPETINEIISIINDWLQHHTSLLRQS
jgi:hypothetical protein